MATLYRMIAFGAGGAVLAALAGCASAPPRQPSRMPSGSLPPVQSIAVSPADYVRRASSASLFVVRASEWVGEREGPTQLGNVARRMRADHQGIAAQLSLAGRRLNLLPAATLLPEHQAALNRLRGTDQPGRAYVGELREVLPRLLTLHDQYRRLGTSPTLRPVGGMAAPVVRGEIEALRGL